VQGLVLRVGGLRGTILSLGSMPIRSSLRSAQGSGFIIHDYFYFSLFSVYYEVLAFCVKCSGFRS